jgi:lysophospholipase L1-like esterase
MFKPFYTFLFIISVGITLGLASYIFPKNGIIVSKEIIFKFPQINSLFQKKNKPVDISKIIAAANNADSNTIINENDTIKNGSDTNSNDSNTITKDSSVKLITAIQKINKSALNNFFDALTELKTNPAAIRVMHYGDSQIEGDRITDYLRMKLQAQFGGNGPGLISFMPVAPSVINKITPIGNWDKYNVFTSKDKRIKHSNFGPLGSINRFGGYKILNDSSPVLSASVKIVTTKLGGTSNQNYKKIKLFYGGAQAKTWCEFYDGPALINADSLEAGGNFNIINYNVANGSQVHELKFSGKDSPDFYGVSLQSDNGVIVDNIGLRGSSGTFFHQINNSQLAQFYTHLNVKLIILQFGGNALPSLKDEKSAANYASYLKNQISILKKLAPNASILFIGPADMSTKDGTDYVTYPMLEPTRDAIKKAVLESDCAFFDMYDCMGGKNSMVSWVDLKLAAYDYIHFSPQGARKIATLLYSALISDYNVYLKNKN